MVTILCILLALVTFIMSMAILVQDPKQAGLSGSFGMGGEQMLGAGTPNAISKFTGFLAVAFLVLCLVIGLVDESVQNKSGLKAQEGDLEGIETTFESADPAAGTGETGAVDTGLGGAVTIDTGAAGGAITIDTGTAGATTTTDGGTGEAATTDGDAADPATPDPSTTPVEAEGGAAGAGSGG